jgi:hypothetical protein
MIVIGSCNIIDILVWHMYITLSFTNIIYFYNALLLYMLYTEISEISTTTMKI